MFANKKMTLTLSLVIPVFNEENHIEACLNAVIGQTVKPLEVIVVDNNSADRTLERARQYPFVKIIKAKKQGVLHARNRGFNAATGQLIGRIDADTILPPRWVETVLAAFEDSSVAAVTGPVDYYDMPLAGINHQFDHLMRTSIYNWSPKSPFLFGSNMAITKDAWQSIKSQLCLDGYMHEDLDLAVHLYKASQKIVYSKKMLSGVSGRRYNDAPAHFYKYMSMYRQTYLRHGLHSLAIYSATGIYFFGYVVIHPWLNVWYGLYGALRPVMPLTRASRKNPMSS